MRAMSSTCTHLGCRVSYDASSKLMRCPVPRRRVHARRATSVAGPPPRPLAELPARSRIPRSSSNSDVLGDWFNDRTGYRAGLRRVLDEPVPGDVNWWFTLGSVLLFLLAMQFVTGVTLTMYYVPTPAHAYDSVRFISTQLTFGRMLRGLHFYGASFIVVFAVLHLLRVLFFGAYKSPREVTWGTGIVLLLLVLAFGLTGYLLPWDQRAYWATVVTINIAKSTPVVGPYIADIMRGGPAIGALTLSRWYATHVILLPVGVCCSSSLTCI